jgi:imidazole glycerol-phosphate synthase subunit HisF
MKRIRIIPALLLMDDGLYKTVKFKAPKYVGDPINTVRIFNEKGADEIVLLDIGVARGKGGMGKGGIGKGGINYKKIAEIAGEAFMPMGYGGGIRTFDEAKRVFDAGFEKVIINSAAAENPSLIGEIAGVYGSQSAVVSIDVRTGWTGGYKVYVAAGSKNTGRSPVDYARDMEKAGAGEVILNSIDRDGTWEGYDIKLIGMVSEAVSIPVIACGGASGMDDFKKAVSEGGASAVAAGSMFVYQKKGMGVLISFPSQSLKI